MDGESWGNRSQQAMQGLSMGLKNGVNRVACKLAPEGIDYPPATSEDVVLEGSSEYTLIPDGDVRTIERSSGFRDI